MTANSYTRSYLAPDPAFGGVLAGFVAGDGISATYTSPGAGSQVPGVYPTVPTLVDPNGKLANYIVTSTNGTLTITNAAPVCNIVPSQASIWPPNHKMVSITASGATDADGGTLTYSVVSIFQDEPTNTTGDGNTAIDGLVGIVPFLGDAFDVMFRANRRNMKLLRDWLDREERRSARA